jgi:DNA modification methylase
LKRLNNRKERVKMEIRKVKISEIHAAIYNPRKNLQPGDAEYEKLKKSIESFGYVDPVVWNSRTGNLVGGHQRFTVLLAKGLTEVETSVVDLSLEREKALNLALNKVQGDWDKNKLALLLDELSRIPDFDIGLTGFDKIEISQIFDGCIETAEEDNFDFDQAVDAIEEPVTHPGELIELGTHRLFCGDASKKEDIEKLIGVKKINLLWVDPTYGVKYSDSNRPQPNTADHKKPSKWRKIQNDNLPQEEYESWLEKVFTNIAGYLDKGSAIYVWNGHRQFGPMQQMLIKLGFHVSCVITWVKESFALGFGDYNQQTEFCLYGWKEDNGRHRWYGPNNESTLWDIKRDPVSSLLHPTQKALALATRAIKNSSQRDDIVLDTFLGSGTALIAAEGLQRVCYGMEIDPCYCDAIVKRYIAFVGKDNVSEEVKNRYLKEVTNG